MDSKELGTRLVKIMAICDRTRARTALAGLLAEAGIDSATVVGYQDAVSKLSRMITSLSVTERGIIPGRTVRIHGHDSEITLKTAVVKSVDKDGYVHLEGRYGAFNPSLLSVFEEKGRL